MNNPKLLTQPNLNIYGSLVTSNFGALFSVLRSSPLLKDVFIVLILKYYSLQDVFDKKWVRSKTAKDGVDETIAKYDGEWVLEASAKNALVGDLGLVMKSKAKHAAIATRLKKPFVFEDKVFIVQYELNFQVSSVNKLSRAHFKDRDEKVREGNQGY